MLNELEKTIEQTGKMTDKMSEKGIGITFSAIVGTLFTAIVIFLMVMLYQSNNKDNNKDITVSFGIAEFKKLSPVRTEMTMLKIHKALSELIDNNHLIHNKDVVLSQIVVIISREVENGRFALSKLGFDEQIVERMSYITDTLKDEAIKAIQLAFGDAIKKLVEHQEQTSRYERDFLRSGNFSYKSVNDFISQMHFRKLIEKRIYIELKSRIWTIFEFIQSETQKFLRGL